MMPAMVNPTWADILSAVSTAASALLTLGLVVLALVAWRTASDALEESRKASLAAQKSAAAAEAANEQLRRDSAEQTRPYVFAEVLPGLAGSPTWEHQDLELRKVVSARVDPEANLLARSTRHGHPVASGVV